MYGEVSALSTVFTPPRAVGSTAAIRRFPACYDAIAGMTSMSLTADVLKKKARAVEVLRGYESAVVALSGGVDSAALLAIAKEALGASRVLAVTGRSDAVGPDEIADASAVAAGLGISHQIVETHEMERDAYRANTGDRCFHCRMELFEILSRIAETRGRAVVTYGAILDDLGDDRPGMRAAADLGVMAPLLDAGICKADARALAKSYGLHVNEKPASPCLASRIPPGTEVTRQRLSQVGTAEAALHRLGFRQVRVRHHGDVARIELGAGESNALADDAMRISVVQAVKAAGFRFVTIDLEPYAEGRLHAATLHSIGPARESGQ
jgi:uncharacterized protein